MKRIVLILTIALPLWGADVEPTAKPNNITLNFNDGKEFEADIDVVKISKTINDMLTDFGDTGEPIPITNISSALFMQTLYPLMQIIHNQQADPGTMTKNLQTGLQKLDFDQTKDLLLAVNYLDIPQLLPLVADHFAQQFTSQPILQRFIEEPNFISSLGLPKDLINLTAQQMTHILNVRKALFQAIDRKPKTIGADRPTSVAFSSDGKTLAFASEKRASAKGKGTIKLWDLSTFQKLHTFTSHTDTVSEVAFSPDGKTLASASQTIKLWDVATGQLLHTFTGYTGWVNSIVFSPDGKTLVSGSDDGTIKIWDLSTRLLLHTFTGHTGIVESVVFSPDGKTLATGSQNGTIKLWDVATGQLLHTFTGYTSLVFSVAFSPDGKTLASGSKDRTIKVWDLSTKQLLHTLTGHTSFVFSVAFSPDGKTLVSGSNDGTIKLWDVATGQLLHTLTGHTFLVRSVAFSPDGKTLASASGDLRIKLWDISFEPLPIEVLLLVLFSDTTLLASLKIDWNRMSDFANKALEKINDQQIKQTLEKYIRPIIEKGLRTQKALETTSAATAQPPQPALQPAPPATTQLQGPSWWQKFLAAFQKTMTQFE